MTTALEAVGLGRPYRTTWARGLHPAEAIGQLCGNAGVDLSIRLGSHDMEDGVFVQPASHTRPSGGGSGHRLGPVGPSVRRGPAGRPAVALVIWRP